MKNLTRRKFQQDTELKSKFKVNIYYQKAYAGKNIGKIDEAREIYTKILSKFEISDIKRNYITKKRLELPKIFNHKIPKNIFQTWETSKKDISPELLYYINSWEKYNKNYKINFYNKEERYKFIKDNFDNNILDAYNRLKPGALKCDLWRLCVLYVYGGFYIDIDTECLSSLDTLCDESIEFICAIDLNPNKDCEYNLSNGFLGSIPKHPLLKKCINYIVYKINNTNPNKKILVTNICGPGCLGINMNKYLNLDSYSSFISKEGIINDTIPESGQILFDYEECKYTKCI